MDGIGTWTLDIASSGNGTWRTSSDDTVSGGTGPSGPHSGSGYLFFESSTGFRHCYHCFRTNRYVKCIK